ncbi:MAG: NlpC/P60 family protein [Micromonosporaceae bacterium]
MERKIEKLASDLGRVVEKYNRTRDELDETKAKAARLAKKIAPLQAKADRIYAKVGEISAAVYKGGRVSIANAILTSGSPKTLIDQLSTLDRLAAEQKKGLDALERVTSKLDRKKDGIDAVLDDQRKIERDLVARKKKIKDDIDKLQEMRRRAYGDRAARDGRRPGYIPPYIPGDAGKVVRYAQAQLGDPYVFGADGPDAFDCSGLTLASWRVVGVSLPHSAKKQYYNTRRVSREDLSPGDIVFYYSDIHHNAVYIGEGWIIHAPEPGRNVEQVRYDKWPIYGYGRPG